MSRRSCRSRSPGDEHIVASLVSPPLPNSAQTTRASSPCRHSVRDIRTGCHSAAAAILPLQEAQPGCNWHPSTRALVVALGRAHLLSLKTAPIVQNATGRPRCCHPAHAAAIVETRSWACLKGSVQSHSVLSSALCWRMCLVAVEGASSFANRKLDLAAFELCVDHPNAQKQLFLGSLLPFPCFFGVEAPQRCRVSVSSVAPPLGHSIGCQTAQPTLWSAEGQKLAIFYFRFLTFLGLCFVGGRCQACI